jgi:hypothetical protein
MSKTMSADTVTWRYWCLIRVYERERHWTLGMLLKQPELRVLVSGHTPTESSQCACLPSVPISAGLDADVEK